MKSYFLFLAILVTLYSCGSSKGPSNIAGGAEPITPGIENLKNRTEITITEAIDIMRTYATSNQAIRIGDRYTHTETQYKDFQGNTDCQIKTVTTYTVIEHDLNNDRLKSLSEASETRSGEKCTTSGITQNRYLTVELNISKKLNFEINEIDSLRIYRGSFNGQLYLAITGNLNYEQQSISYEVLTNPKRPLWTEADYSKVDLDGTPYTTSISTAVTNVDTQGTDTTGLGTVYIQN